jgi:hypothetical protein
VSEADSNPDDAVLLELGRVGYAAISLEPIIDMLCRWVEGPGGQVDNRPTGDKIKTARRKLEADPTIPGRSEALDWLGRADAAMERRNAVFHGEPGVEWNVIDEEAMGAGDLMLLHRSRRRNGPVTKTLLNVEGLRDVLADLEDALSGWQEVFSPIGEWRLAENARKRAEVLADE